VLAFDALDEEHGVSRPVMYCPHPGARWARVGGTQAHPPFPCIALYCWQVRIINDTWALIGPEDVAVKLGK